jgi:hypothetical protein
MDVKGARGAGAASAPTPSGAAGNLILPLYAGTLFLSAFLLFSVQPMFTKMVLPRLGGSPTVWNTAMVFFQATLLAGYLYAHLSSRWLGIRAQQVVHGALLLSAFVFLPIAIAESAEPPTEGSPVFWLIGVLAASVGLPFLAASATAPLLQRWFAHVDHPSAADPYFLYGGSNLGSLAALLAYPLVIESTLGLVGQSRAWTLGYVLLAAAIAACGWLLLRTYRANAHASGEAGGLITDVTATLRVRWLLLSMVPSAMLLGATLHVGTDIAAAPFFWVLPLALYLLSFVFVFARRPLLPHAWMVFIQAIWLVLVAVLFDTPHLYVLLVLHLGGVFFTAMVCHGELSRLRPTAARLTEFYLWLSLGGVLGGLFAGIIAPLVFNGVYEYPLAMLAAVLLRPSGGAKIAARLAQWTGISALAARSRCHSSKRLRRRRRWMFDVILPLGLFALLTEERWETWTRAVVDWAFAQDLFGVASRTLTAFLPWESVLGGGLFMVSTMLLLWSLSGRPLRFALGIVAVFGIFSPDLLGTLRYRAAGDGEGFFAALPRLIWSAPDYRLERVRSFFGVYSVNYARANSGEYHILVNGTTNHGAQNQTYPMVPVTYYAREGPVGQVFSVLRSTAGDAPSRIAAIGLGAGALSCFVGADQSMTFYEIDPVDAALAQDQRFFTYLSSCGRGPIDIVIGDGRRNIAKAPDGYYDVIFVDAFSGDAIPVHLLTKEATELYFRKLSPKGMVLFHITNTYINLLPVVANIVQELGLHARHVEYHEVMMTPFALPSEWVVVARPDRNDLARFGWQMVPWDPPKPDPRIGVWTDDYSNVIRSLRWEQYGVVPVGWKWGIAAARTPTAARAKPWR